MASQENSIGGVTVRMYRGILGDCFLVRVASGGGSWKTMLIDCGVLQNVQDGKIAVTTLPKPVVKAVGRSKIEAIEAGKDRIRKIAEDIATTLREPDGKIRIDILVVTHEHYDHISGFALARDIWEDPKLEIGQLWMAWTENERDEDAIALRAHLGSAKHAVVRAAMAAQVLGAAGKSDELDALTSLADFIGPLNVDGMALSDPGDLGEIPPTIETLRVNALALEEAREKRTRMTTADTMAMLKTKAGADRIFYWEPGDIIEPSSDFGLKSYVLGPPRNVERIKKDTPSAGEKSEVYLTERDQVMAVEATALRMLERAGSNFGIASASSEVAAASAHPFARPHSRAYVYGQWDAAKDGKTETPERARIRKLYETDGAPRIDAEWLSGAEALALKLDSDTNNTSLVLAFELPNAHRSILLFPGDAQVGNWLSWGDQKYPRADDGPPQQSVEELLARVVFYKVGHHASHNATAKARGLELMTHGNIVAAIPLVEAVAQIQGPGKKTPGRGWKMPYDHLHERLAEKTDGRIVQGDGDPGHETDAFRARPDSPDIDYGPDNLWVELTFRAE